MVAGIETTVRADDIEALARRLKAEEDGKRLRREFAKALRQAAQPAVGNVRHAVLSLPGGHVRAKDGPSLRAGVSRKVRATARLSGRTTGVAIVVPRAGMPRNFTKAAKNLDSSRGWRHPVFGHRDRWVTQTTGRPYFDRAVTSVAPQVREALARVVEETARRIGGN